MKFERIVDDWKRQFPILSQYTPSTLFVKADVILIGLRLDKVWDDQYRVFLEILPLWKENKRETGFELLRIEMLNKKGLQFFINFGSHEKYRDVAFECAKRQFGSILKEKIAAVDIFRLIDEYFVKPSTDLNPLDISRILELKFALAIFGDNIDLVEIIKQEIDDVTNLFDKAYFKVLTNNSIEGWKKNMYQRIGNRENLMAQLAHNIANKKVAKLKDAHILYKPTNSEVRQIRLSRVISSILKRFRTRNNDH